MGCFKNITGQRFGYLVAQHPTEERKRGSGTVKWLCLCLLCGRTKAVALSNLQCDTKSCGCWRNDPTYTNTHIPTKSRKTCHGRGAQSGLPPTSEFKGVSRDKDLQKWRAEITAHRKHKHLGTFESEVDAAKAYDKAAIELHGEFAKLNFPIQGTPTVS